MKFFFVGPEVAGELGGRTALDPTTHPPTLHHLHYEFHGWLGDALVESFPCWILTDAASAALRAQSVSGVQFSDVEVSKSAKFEELHPQLSLPKFRWLKVLGNAEWHDFGLANDHRLVLSEKALGILKGFGLGNAIIEDCD